MEDDLTFADTGCCCCGCAAAAPAAPVDVEPEPIWEEPVWVEPAPLWEEPAYVEPAPVAPPPPVYVEPAPVAPVAPAAPVYVEPAPVEPSPVYVEPAPVEPSPVYEAPPVVVTAPAPTPAPVPSSVSIVGGNSFSDDITIVDPSGAPVGPGELLGPSIVGGGSSWNDAFTIVDPSGAPASSPSTMTIGGGTSSGGGMGGLGAITELVAGRQEAHRAALDGATWAPGISGDADAVTRGIVTSNQLRLLHLSERNLNDVMSPLWHSSDQFDPYSPRYPGRA